MTDLVRVRHTVSGQIAEVPENIADHYVLGRYLERVDGDAKPYLPEMHKPHAVAVVDEEAPTVEKFVAERIALDEKNEGKK